MHLQCLSFFIFSLLSFHLFLFKYSCLHFPSTISPNPPTPTSHPQFYPALALSLGPLSKFLGNPSGSFHRYLPPLSPLITVSLFFISKSLVIFCLLLCFVYQVPLTDDIIWHFYVTSWLISLSIMLSSSIMLQKRAGTKVMGLILRANVRVN